MNQLLAHQIQLYCHYYRNNYYHYDDSNVYSINEVDSFSGCCMMFVRDVYNVIGGFDENYFLYFEDTDFCYRVKQLGLKVVFYPKAQIIHYKGESVKYKSIDKPTFNLKLTQYKKAKRKYFSQNFWLT